jgi:hypothetical protein
MQVARKNGGYTAWSGKSSFFPSARAGDAPAIEEKHALPNVEFLDFH